MAVLAVQLVSARNAGDLRALLDVMEALGMDAAEHPITVSVTGAIEAVIEVDQMPMPIGPPTGGEQS